jgi:hypothetical protein
MVASKSKKPWQMTRTEYLGAVAAKQWTPKNKPQLEGRALQDKLRHVYYEEHKQIVQRALSEGKPVPAEVLKDYPELARGAKLHVGVKAGKP